ncbi:hypothetical protein WME94_06310 [Sorangium sp. So ce429]
MPNAADVGDLGRGPATKATGGWIGYPSPLPLSSTFESAGHTFLRVAPEALSHGDPVVLVDPTRISIAHWGRLDEGELFAKSRHIDWAVLMKRT